MLCISRITDDTYSQKFGNGHHKFFIELRCNQRCVSGLDVCSRCQDKSDSCKVQTSRKFNHGKITEPIPDGSRIYGGKWYLESVGKYGPPSKDIIEFAEKYQREAREGSTIPIKNSSSAFSLISLETSSSASASSSTDSNPTENSKKTTSTGEKSKSSQKSKKKPIINTTPTNTNLIHKEVTVPTHIETTLEEFDTDDYDIEYVKLTIIEIDKKSYFIDSKKGKIYKKIKDKEIGPYIGRLNSETNTIVSDIPDSDDEE